MEWSIELRMARELLPLSQRFADVEFKGSVRRWPIRVVSNRVARPPRWAGTYIAKKATLKGHVTVQLSAAVVGKV
jgi:hypothetical protein